MVVFVVNGDDDKNDDEKLVNKIAFTSTGTTVGSAATVVTAIGTSSGCNAKKAEALNPAGKNHTDDTTLNVEHNSNPKPEIELAHSIDVEFGLATK